MFDVDECGEAAAFLGLGNDGQGEGRFPRGFRAEDFDDPAPREAADAQGAIDEEVAGWDDVHIGTFVVAEAHDGSLAEFFLDVGDGEVQIAFAGFLQFFVRGFFGGCFSGHGCGWLDVGEVVVRMKPFGNKKDVRPNKNMPIRAERAVSFALDASDRGCYSAWVLTCDCLEKLAGFAEPLHLALGVFDGVHLGHQAVIGRAVRAAAAEGGLPGLVTFDPHPIRVIAPGKAPAALLATLAHKRRIVGGLGVRVFVALRFDAAMAAMAACDFLDRLTAAPVKTIAVGEDWRFGRGRMGDVAFLAREAQARGYRLEAVPPVMFEGDRISSTRIRQAIHDGNLDEATRMLGRPYSIAAEVIEGEKLGRALGFPTANLPVEGVQLPPDGVWAVRAGLEDGSEWLAVANLGCRPTVNGTRRLLEVHLLDFSGDLYAQPLEVRFEKKLRGEIRFPSMEALRDQIGLDVKTAREHFGV